MNQYKPKDGGDLIIITPSARKSIHSHKSCPFASGERNMTRYGLDESSKPRSPQTGTDVVEDRDETDNVMRFPSPVRAKPKRVLNRSNSYPEHDEDSSEPESEIAKSLPTYLQSHTSSREESYARSLPRRSFNSSHDWSHDSDRLRTPQPPDSSYTGERRSPKNYNYSPKRSSKSNSSTTILLLISLVVLVAGVFYSSQNNLLDINGIQSMLMRKELYDGLKFSADLEALGEKYNLDEDSILKVQTGISTIHQKDIAGSFIFVYDSKRKSFNERKFLDVVNRIASLSAKYLRNESSSVQHLILEGGNLHMKDHGELIRAYRDIVAEKGVLLVKDIDNLPHNLAMAFHYYCDEYDPLIRKSAIFFTLDLGNCSLYTGERSIHALLERCLSNKWRGLQHDNIGPLLTRVITCVVDIA